MSRDIKFRVYDKWTKQMLPVLSIDCKETFSSERGDNVLMQYTGLKDKNDKEIYEGDIIEIKYKEYAFDGSTLIDRCIKGYIDYHYLSFDICIGEHDGIKTYSCFVQEMMLVDNFIDEEWEVIGNIYENPELLEE